jgi:hypothetical protein
VVRLKEYKVNSKRATFQKVKTTNFDYDNKIKDLLLHLENILGTGIINRGVLNG